MKKTKSGIDWKSSQIFDFAIEILILIVIFIMPTVFDRRLGIVFSGTKVAWMRAFGSIILGIWAIKLIVTRQHRFVRTALDWPVLSFLLCTTIATLSSVHVYTSFVGFYGRYEGLTSWYLYGLFFFVITNYIRTFKQLKRIIMTVMIAAVLMSIYSIIQRFEVDPYMWGGVVTWQRVIGMIGQPNFLAAYMLMAFFMVLAMFLMKEKEIPAEIDKSPANKLRYWYDQLFPIGYFILSQVTFLAMIYNLGANNVFLWYFGLIIITTSALLFAFSYEKLNSWILYFILGMCLVLIYICILFTQSRGGYMGLFTGIVFFAVVAGRHWIFANWKKISVLAFLIMLVSGITMTSPEFSPFARFVGEVTTEKAEVEGKTESKLELKGAAGSRGETWKSAFQIIADYPFFGIGPEVLKMVFPRYETELFRFKEDFHVKQDRCHNETFDVGVTKGLVAFLVYLWLLFTMFRIGWLKSKGAGLDIKMMLAGLLAAALAFLIQNQFSFGVVAITSLFWIICGMVMVVEEREGEEKEAVKFSWLEIPWFSVAAVTLFVLFLIYISFFSFRGDLWFKSGKNQMLGNRYPQAAEDLERSLKVFPFEGSTVSQLGLTYIYLSNTSSEKMEYLNKAIATLNYGTRIDSYNADNFLLLTKIHLMLANKENPQALDQAEGYARSALKIDPYYAEVYYNLGLIQERKGQFDEAARNYKKAFLINPNLKEPMDDLESLYSRQGKQAEALKVFEGAMEKYPDYPIFSEKVVRQYLMNNMIKEAVELAEKMIRRQPEQSTGFILKAMANMRLGELESAFSDLQHVIMNDPKNTLAHNELGRLYLLQGKKSKAREEFEQVLRLDANNAFAKTMLERLK